MRSCSRVQSSEIRSTESSPSSRRPVWIASSKRLSAIWRKTVATVSSIRPTSRSRRARGSSSRSISVSNVRASPKTDAVSASVSGVRAFSRPRSCASDAVQAVAELVRERQHAAPLAGVVHEHVRVDVRDIVAQKAPGDLPRPQRGVDPVAARRTGRRCRPPSARSPRTTRARARARRPSRSCRATSWSGREAVVVGAAAAGRAAAPSARSSAAGCRSGRRSRRRATGPPRRGSRCRGCAPRSRTSSRAAGPRSRAR